MRAERYRRRLTYFPRLLRGWVNYALKTDAVIFFDAAYEAFIEDPAIPHSIYEIEGAKRCAIEFRSFSKTAGFTGVRCALTVVPEELVARTISGGAVRLDEIWKGASRPSSTASPIRCRRHRGGIQRRGWKQTREIIDYYMENARIIRDGLASAGLTVYGGVNAPYIWLKTPQGLASWEFFDKLLNECHVVGTRAAVSARPVKGSSACRRSPTARA